MQYLYTQEEHDRVKTDKEEFERRVNADVDRCLKAYRSATADVLVAFVKEFAHRGDPYRPFGVSISIEDLRRLSKAISKAHGIKDEETCDKKH